MKSSFFFLTILASIILFLNNACSQEQESSENTVATGNGTFSIENDLIIYDDPNRRSDNTYISVKGKIDVQPTAASLQALNNSNYFARIEVNSINDKGFKFPAVGRIHFNKDSTVTFEITINKLQIENSGLKVLPKEMSIEGSYVYYGDTLKYPLKISAELDPNELNIYSRIVNGDLETEIGLKIDRTIVKGLVLNLYDCFKSGLPIDLSEFKSVQNLYIRGLMIDQPFPEEIYKLDKLTALTFDVTNVNLYGTSKDISEYRLHLPAAVFNFKNLKSLTFHHTMALSIPDIPKNCPLERFEVFSRCLVDSIPHSITNLRNLRNLSFHVGSIQSPLPDDLNKLILLDMLMINLPDAIIPENFGPWPNLKKVNIVQTNNSGLEQKEFLNRVEGNIPVLRKIFSNVDDLRINGTNY